jgi:hypothetical protein
MKLKVNEVVIPWMSELYEKNTNTHIVNPNISTMIDKILNNSQNILDNSVTKSNFITNIEDFVEKNENLINQISIISKDSNKMELLTRKWEKCSNKITDYINEYTLNDIKGENVSRWPLFVMLSAAIVCFGFSTSFHWFSIYSKELYSFLCRLDYAGITFLIPGSCYPPYFYFYYCEKCK